MTEFTRVNIDMRSRSARRALSSLERLHAVVAKSVNPVDTTAPGSDDSSLQGRTLWRLDSDIRGWRAKLYVVAPVVPDIAVLSEQLGIKPADYSTCSYGPFLQRLEQGQEWGFRLKANPTKSERSKPGENQSRGKLVALVKEEDQIHWLADKGRHFGFHMPINRLESSEVLVRSAQGLNFERQNAIVTLNSVVFDGVLAIDDPDLLRTALLRGIGRAKGYGFGLLTLVPLPGHHYGGSASRG
ncbi:MAG: type I-E CRISPR-associated protein Cas6/Cse3/CasE [Bifidobacterium tibiigranuli]|jgi:CRISPR system Cascade subunit CasE|uniref:type I-E CRISPR-associated protein Cas6/Cse3/CasE n=1 Tax=Bifidobacterium tibiigranuli TaxID=2172043 RepID=UPI002357A6D8|nr:type I-E CRISPR-associated protein Cas6/Cse3/CasE [Bifidobacterium tibiigranuli]MCH3974962.1 type I-E CRISPR-associated protein Cas6/Cse3/CasE [Bifidobacterium tibiigranuli]MCH4189183.1 type I-E CRISPR-associated protein Cas6/Cse3/CasE [Bifidobacterium tibiigranuli]MCH4202722.1 type I-E CRISPR-associated protein Cas6/Cse3/CasE [Bifidobacterium tibiigranuli]MCH4273739.1 type I-E CRISPR-associated protein Cas6/Cse3/CasE [Bifidobacterium tibiigranuli]MCI1254141.1 type I-E CRISPR-associated pro